MAPNLLSGATAALAAAVIGAGWQITTRHGVTTTLGPAELATLRYCIPALVLAPLWWRTGLKPAQLPWTTWMALVAGGGLPFGLLVLAGAQYAPAAHIGVFMAGTMPLFTALAAWWLLGERVAPARWLGFGVILVGIVLLALESLALALGSWRGDVLFLAAAMAWALHTVAFRRSGMAVWHGAAVVNGVSALAVLLLAPFWAPVRLWTAPWQDVLLQAVWQGGLAGLLGLATYMAAVRRLGASQAALSSALVPLLTAAGGAAWLGERLTAGTLGAAAAVALGVVLASGLFARPAGTAAGAAR